MDDNLFLIATSVGVLGITALGIAVLSMGGITSRSSNQQPGGISNAEVPLKAKDAAVNNNAQKYPKGKMSIYFGSQTGTAEGFARVLMEESKKQGFDAATIDLEDFDADVLASTPLAVFLMATYGEGEPTDNAATFSKWMKNNDDSISPNYLSNVKFCVFGLGNKQYEHFNRMGKLTDECLGKLGGKRIMDVGLGDDDGALEDDFENWREQLWPALTPVTTNASVQSSVSSLTEDRTVDVQFTVSYSPISRSEVSSSRHSVHSLSKPLFSSVEANVSSIRELRQDSSDGSTLHIEVDLSATNVSYTTADNLAVFADNTADEVEKLCASQGYNSDDVFDIVPIAEKQNSFKRLFPTPCKVSDALKFYLDIKGPLRPSTLAQLLPFVEDSEEKQWLQNILRRDNKIEFKSVIEGNRHSFLSLLTTHLKSCKIPFHIFLHIVPVQQPRYYTISSSSSLYPLVPHLALAVTEEKLATDATFTGQCSGLFKRMREERSSPSNKKIRIFVKESSFRLPTSLATPVIMIGPGTGLAPMRALLQERQYRRSQTDSEYGSTTLYFGCKRRDVDHIYKEEMEAFANSGVLTNLHIAYSREGAEKVYVQHLMSKNASSIWSDIQKGAYIYVCGATAMGSDVHKALASIAVSQDMSNDEAEKLLQSMKNTGRYIQELWN